MNITYVLLSPTFGMHQYTADLANRADRWNVRTLERWNVETPERANVPTACPEPVEGSQRANVPTCQRANVPTHQRANVPTCQRANVHLITTSTAPRDRYSPAVTIHTPVTMHGTGFSREALDIAAYRRTLNVLTCQRANVPTHQRANVPTPQRANVPTPIHFTGVHLWNIPLVHALCRRGVPVIHTLHDLDPHHGVRFGGLIRLWNRLILASGCHILVHGRRYRDQLIAQGVPAARVTYAPLLHGFLAADQPWPPARTEVDECKSAAEHERPRTVIFFGRIEAYKGVETLLAAWPHVPQAAGLRPDATQAADVPQAAGLRPDDSGNIQQRHRLIIAGPIARDVTLPPIPPGVELRDRRIMDDEAAALFRSADLLVLPYRDATQSALIAAAYAYGVPVIVAEAGALPEYVARDETGWVVPPADPQALAGALVAALSDPARLARMVAACRTWFETRRNEEEAILAEMYYNQGHI